MVKNFFGINRPFLEHVIIFPLYWLSLDRLMEVLRRFWAKYWSTTVPARPLWKTYWLRLLATTVQARRTILSNVSSSLSLSTFLFWSLVVSALWTSSRLPHSAVSNSFPVTMDIFSRFPTRWLLCSIQNLSWPTLLSYPLWPGVDY